MKTQCLYYKNRQQSGFALISVMILGAMAMLLVSGFFGENHVSERREQERLLLGIRAYWATQGHVSYAISRGRQGPPCGSTCPEIAARETFYALSSLELLNFKGDKLEGHGLGTERYWLYPEISENYQFPIQVTAKKSDDKSRIVFDFKYISTSFPGNDMIDLSYPLKDKSEIHICPGLALTSDPCPINETSMDPSSGIARISYILPQ